MVFSSDRVVLTVAIVVFSLMFGVVLLVVRCVVLIELNVVPGDLALLITIVDKG